MNAEQQESKAGILLVNIGSPEAPTKDALRTYLKEFLWDRRVIDLPRWQWWLILNVIILNVRPARSAELYKRIWMKEGAPLIVETERQVEGIQLHFEHLGLDNVVVDYAMRYGNPSIESKLVSMKERGIQRVLILPMYPQYSDATTASVFDGVAKALENQRFIPELRFVRNWHYHPLYIDALANSVRTHFEKHGVPDKLLISFHGVPRRYIDEGDGYYDHCTTTTRLLVDKLQLAPEKYQLVFQSHFGKEEWLRPYADETIRALPSEGVKRISVICPGFSTDCLETLEEIAITNKELFIEAGGERYEYIPCLNSSSEHIRLLSDVIHQHTRGWSAFESSPHYRQEHCGYLSSLAANRCLVHDASAAAASTA